MAYKGGVAAVAALVSQLAIGYAGAQEKWTWTGCADVTGADLKKTVLADRTKGSFSEPVRIDLANDGRVFIAERGGTVKLYSAGNITSVAKLNVWTDDIREMGIHGLVLDPNFDTNKQIFIHYAPATPDAWRISRFTFTGTSIDLASEKILLEIPVQRRTCCHTGGDMQFDLKGDLWITMGNNTTNGASDLGDVRYVNEADPTGDGDDQGHAANTNDLRGKILRIHPVTDPVAGKYYTIPAGNLKEAYASLWSAPDLEKVRPEIYTMGHRNPYTLSVDKYRGWLMWGDIGPDDSYQTEEYNLVTKPGNMGWPYFAGAAANPNYKYKLNKDPAAPVNNSKWNTGVKTLPPAQGAIIGYSQSAAITGPIYHYDGANPSKIKLPPHFDGKWFLSDWNNGRGGYIKVATPNAAGTAVTDNRALIATNTLRGPIALKFGPDGALYVLEYGNSYFNTTADTKLSRYEGNGACVPALPVPVSIGAPKKGIALIASHNLGFARDFPIPEAARSARVFDIQGKSVWEVSHLAASGAQSLHLPTSLGIGVYRVKFEF